MARDFDWDKWLSRASYSEVVALSPAMPTDRPLPLYSPDRKFLYLSTTDSIEKIDDQDGLKQQLLGYKKLFEAAKAEADYRRAWLIQVECREICGLLSNLVESPEQYGDSDRFLE